MSFRWFLVSAVVFVVLAVASLAGLAFSDGYGKLLGVLWAIAAACFAVAAWGERRRQRRERRKD